jgi:predicted amidohydrolase
MKLNIAVYQGVGVRGDTDRALAVVRRVVTRAVARGVRLVIFPELFLSGYNTGAAVRSLAEPAVGPSAEAIAAIAVRTGVAVLYGYPERDGRRTYNSAQLIDGSGRSIANYRKTHLYGAWERRVFTPGDALVTATVGELKIGILICYDVEFPEAVRALALAGAGLVAVPTALVQPFDIVARTLVPARAFENQVYVAYAGLCGEEGDLGYCGLSCVIGPDGRELSRAGRRPGLLCAEIDPGALAASRRLNPYLTDRRPGLYAQPAARQSD